ncbi:MAG: PEP-CTERM sorting domain-containing protein [Verrucomicrobiaceae bacterium]|nr:MAG: PEP-CTERM sorting domain-containing protein [Verrucomicrobiaceae bacterium]
MFYQTDDPALFIDFTSSNQGWHIHVSNPFSKGTKRHLVSITPPYKSNMKKPGITTRLVSGLGIIALASASHAAVLIDEVTRNGSFESPNVGAGDAKNGFDMPGKDLDNWFNTTTTWAGATGATYGDVGVDFNAGGSHSGSQFAFFHGGDGGAYNLTTYEIQAGDQFTLTWWGRADTLGVRLFSSTDLTYNTAATLAEISQAQPGGYAQYSLTYNAAPADVGKTIGVSIFNPLAGYANVDDVELSVIPEPASSAVFALGSAAFLLRRSRRRTTV